MGSRRNLHFDAVPPARPGSSNQTEGNEIMRRAFSRYSRHSA